MLTKSVTYDAFLEGQATKSAKIRALARAGVPTAEIARHLGIRYQHARNVILDAGLQSTGPNSEGMEEAAVPFLRPAAAADQGGAWLTLEADGRVAIPENLLAAVGLKPGDRVHVALTEDGLEMFSRKAALDRVHKIARKYVPEGVSIVDDFIAERRQEALAEDARWNERFKQ